MNGNHTNNGNKGNINTGEYNEGSRFAMLNEELSQEDTMENSNGNN